MGILVSGVLLRFPFKNNKEEALIIFSCRKVIDY